MTNKELRAYARRFGFAPSTVTGWIQNGIPKTTLAMLLHIKKLETAQRGDDFRLACRELDLLQEHTQC